MLAVALEAHHSLRLVFLNSCEGDRAARNDPFAGIAQNLLRRNIPAVIANQFKISDPAAVTLAREFYAAIADNLSVEHVLTQARKAIWFDHDNVEWGTPALYLRSEDSQIFVLHCDSQEPAPKPPTEPPSKPESPRKPFTLKLVLQITFIVVLAQC
jgi:CHAT domain